VTTSSTSSARGPGGPGGATVATGAAGPDDLADDGPPAATRSLAWGPGEVPGKHDHASGIGPDNAYCQILIRPLIRAQLGLSLVCLAFALAVTASLPILCGVLPSVSKVTVLGLPLTLIALGVGVFPVLLLIGTFYTRQAARLEKQFIALMDRVDGITAGD
jgi:hypothetical protein